MVTSLVSLFVVAPAAFVLFRLFDIVKPPPVCTAERLGGATEKEVFAAVGLPLIPPELRENSGEFEAADEGGIAEVEKVLREHAADDR